MSCRICGLPGLDLAGHAQKLRQGANLMVGQPDYDAYAARVPILLPRMAPAETGSRRFEWRLYLKNREYQAAAGFVAGIAFLLWKALRH